MDYSTPSFPVHHHQFPELTQTHVHWVSDAIQPSYPLFFPSPPTFNLSQGLFQWVSFLHQVDKVLEFQLQHQSFQWMSGLISFRIDWFDLLVVQWTLKSLIWQMGMGNACISMADSCQCRTKTTTIMSLLFNMLSSLVITFLPRSKCLLISWL